MKTNRIWLVSAFFILLSGVFSACAPVPNCGVSDYYVTKEDDTADGVCSAGDCSLREAVQNANACAGHQTIHLPAGGYILTRHGPDEDAADTGDLDITDDLTLIGTGAPSIDGDGDRALHVHSPAVVEMEMVFLTGNETIIGAGILNETQLTLNDFTCNYNSAVMPPGGMGDARGGCIFNTGDLTVNNGHFLENTARYGGAIYTHEFSSLTVSDTVFIGNQAEDHGGALFIDEDATVSITDVDFQMNSAGLYGGAFWNNGTATFTSVLLEENDAADNGGASYTWESGSSIHYSTWYKDNTAAQGGGVFNSGGLVQLYQSSVTGNAATGPGGGFYNEGPLGGLLLRNTTISGNSAGGGSGGGIYNTGNLMLEFITVAANSGEGIHVNGGTEIKIRSSIVAGNTGSSCAGLPLDSLGFNIDDGASCGFSGMDDLTSSDPLLQPAAANGGAGLSHALDPSSPAIDTGDPDRCLAEDQRGVARPQGAACDRGALELETGMGSISGYTYIDENENGLRDPGEGWVRGAMLTLKEGPCPGTAEIETVESGEGGAYELTNIPAGTYCLAKSPLQETFDPESYDLILEPGVSLTEINFRFQGLPLADGTISGLVWHDLCAVPEGTSSIIPPGCIELPEGGLSADGVYDPAEPGIENVEVRLGVGACPGSELDTQLTDASGNYNFSGVYPGVYCVSVDPLAPPNDTILIPGGWTYPVRGAEIAEHEVSLGDSGTVPDLNFGWDYQFLPAPDTPTATPTPEPAGSRGSFSKDGFCRFGPGTNYQTVTGFLAGREVEIVARSEPELPLWWYIRDLELDLYCWASTSVIETKVNPEDTDVRVRPPTQTPPPPTREPLVCTKDLNETKCLKAGGTWTQPLNKAGDAYCDCP